MNINDLKSLLSRFNIKPSKKLGQNFLLNEEVLDKIIQSADLSEEDTVLEIGPGLGQLTRKLAEKAGLVLAVEKDRKLVKALRKLYKSKDNIKIIQGDALFINPEDLFTEPGDSSQDTVENRSTPQQGSSAGSTGYSLQTTDYKIVANLPYYITGKFLKNIFTSDTKPESMVLLLQKEVAERITAKPGDMSVLAVSVQLYSEPEIIMEVPKKNFYPVPQVDSALVRVNLRESPRFSVDDRKFMQLVKVGFSNKRKMLKNNLAAGLRKEKTKIEAVLEENSIDKKVRAEDLSLEEWDKVYKNLILTK